MKFISTRTHGILDYLMGALLIVMPWVLGFADDSAKTMVPVILGASVIVYSLITEYELSLAKVLPMPVHLALDIAGGLFLAASPYIFGFSYEMWVPHVALGLIEVVTALSTESYSIHHVSGFSHKESLRH